MLLVSSSHYFSFSEPTNEAPATTPTTTAATKKKILLLAVGFSFQLFHFSTTAKKSEEYSLICEAGHLAIYSQSVCYIMLTNCQMIFLFLEYRALPMVRHTSEATNLLAQHPNAHLYRFEHNSILFHPIWHQLNFLILPSFYTYIFCRRNTPKSVSALHRISSQTVCSHIFRMPKIRRKTQTYIYGRALRYRVRASCNKRNMNFMPAGW